MSTPQQTPHVVMLCGIAGAGKTTYAMQLVAKGYARLSIDEALWHQFGRYGIDYAPDQYEALQQTTELQLRNRLPELIRSGSDIVIDFSFWQRERRVMYRNLVLDAGGTPELVYLKASRALLLERLRGRGTRFDADAAFPVPENLLDAYLAGFEVPTSDEQATVIDQT